MYWEPYGTPSDIKNMLDIDEDRRRVFAECGGYCGGCKARGGKLTVEVDYCQEGVKCKECVAELIKIAKTSFKKCRDIYFAYSVEFH